MKSSRRERAAMGRLRLLAGSFGVLRAARRQKKDTGPMFLEIIKYLIIFASLGSGIWIIRRSFPGKLRLPRLSIFD